MTFNDSTFARLPQERKPLSGSRVVSPDDDFFSGNGTGLRTSKRIDCKKVPPEHVNELAGPAIVLGTNLPVLFGCDVVNLKDFPA
ncbi:MAG TPA: hypothetical protein VGC73_08305, partial [Pyrinomonadaceae bacterium]